MASSYASENDFDMLCQYFVQMDKLNNVEGMTNTQRNDYIIKQITEKLPKTSNARASWLAIDSATPEMRYELVISSAESVLKKKWQCLAMQKWSHLTGEF